MKQAPEYAPGARRGTSGGAQVSRSWGPLPNPAAPLARRRSSAVRAPLARAPHSRGPKRRSTAARWRWRVGGEALLGRCSSAAPAPPASRHTRGALRLWAVLTLCSAPPWHAAEGPRRSRGAGAALGRFSGGGRRPPKQGGRPGGTQHRSSAARAARRAPEVGRHSRHRWEAAPACAHRLGREGQQRRRREVRPHLRLQHVGSLRPSRGWRCVSVCACAMQGCVWRAPRPRLLLANRCGATAIFLDGVFGNPHAAATSSRGLQRRRHDPCVAVQRLARGPTGELRNTAERLGSAIAQLPAQAKVEAMGWCCPMAAPPISGGRMVSSDTASHRAGCTPRTGPMRCPRRTIL